MLVPVSNPPDSVLVQMDTTAFHRPEPQLEYFGTASLILQPGIYRAQFLFPSTQISWEKPPGAQSAIAGTL